MENNYNSELMAEQNSPRPQLLSVSCILTWVCCGLMFILSLWGLLRDTPENRAQQIEKMRQVNPEMADKMEEAMSETSNSSKQVNTAVNFICLAFSAIGATLMWQLKKKGFYLYLAGEIVPYTGMFLSGKTSMAALSGFGSMGTTIFATAIAIMIIFDAVFIGFYAVNLKHMK
ncbi:MAG: hypothetical protein JSU07_04875 [Bacteroidetes bacterium]|nr:hypothetical protein [Bacteroidota bacterium]